MSLFVALLRAVNVGGTGKLPMQDLKALCEKVGFTKVRTYIASGNVLFESGKSEKAVKSALEKALLDYAGKPVSVMVRTPSELEKVLKNNPFPKAQPSQTIVIFLDAPPPRNAASAVTGAAGEEVRMGKREIYVNYVNGLARSKLKIPAGVAGTGRNVNTIAKLVELSARP